MHKVAVATSDRQTINEHFGRARSFSVYEIYDGGKYKFLEDIVILPSLESEPDLVHSAATDRISALAGIRAVLAAQIGKNAQQLLANSGIRAYTVGGSIDKALETYGKRIPLIERMSKACGSCTDCPGGQCSVYINT